MSPVGGLEPLTSCLQKGVRYHTILRASFALSCAAGWELTDALIFDRDHHLVRLLRSERSRLYVRDLRSHVVNSFLERNAVPAVAIPIFEADDLTAFAVYGFHRGAPL
jgi:hypothetical protein